MVTVNPNTAFLTNEEASDLLMQVAELKKDRDRYKVAADELFRFIRTHVRIVGQEEIDGYYFAKEYYDIARNHE